MREPVVVYIVVYRVKGHDLISLGQRLWYHHDYPCLIEGIGCSPCQHVEFVDVVWPRA